MIGTVPSLMELLICLTLINMDITVSSPLLLASNINNRNFFKEDLTRETQYKRFKEASFNDNITTFENYAIRSALTNVLVALTLFDECMKTREDDEIKAKKNKTVLPSVISV
jgi:hypothetical protein